MADRRTAAGMRALVVDDDEATRTLYVTLLEEVDGVTTVFAAGDGVEAVQLAKETTLDLVLLDLNMPRLDGVRAAAEIKAVQPEVAIALQSSDPGALHRRAASLDLPLFDKLELDRMLAWVAHRVAPRRTPGGC